MKKKTLAIIVFFAVVFLMLSRVKAVEFDYGEFGGLPYDPPIVTVVSPFSSAIYNVQDIPINVTVQIRGWILKNIEQIRWLNYSLDGHTPTSLTLTVPSMYGIHAPYNVYGNYLLPGLTDGNHNLTVYGETFIGGMTCYFNETVSFTVDTANTPEPESFPTSLVIASSVTVTVVLVGLGLLLYGIKRK